jgi:hypothetical protein
MCFLPDWIFSWKDYWFALIGAGLGAWIAIKLTEQQKKEIRKIEIERIRTELITALDFNLDLAEKAMEWLNKEGMPSFTLDTTKLAHLTLEAYGFLDPQLIKDIDWHRYQLDHITEKLSAMKATIFSCVVLRPLNPAIQHMESDLNKMFSDDLKKHFAEIQNGTPKLKNRIKGV